MRDLHYTKMKCMLVFCPETKHLLSESDSEEERKTDEGLIIIAGKCPVINVFHETTLLPINEIQIDTHCVQKMISYSKKFLYVFGCKKKIVRYEIYKTTNQPKVAIFSEKVQAMKLFKFDDENPRIIVALEGGVIRMLN
jgi:hypothetical protein